MFISFENNMLFLHELIWSFVDGLQKYNKTDWCTFFSFLNLDVVLKELFDVKILKVWTLQLIKITFSWFRYYCKRTMIQQLDYIFLHLQFFFVFLHFSIFVHQ